MNWKNLSAWLVDWLVSEREKFDLWHVDVGFGRLAGRLDWLAVKEYVSDQL